MWLQFGVSGSNEPNALVTHGETKEIGIIVGDIEVRFTAKSLGARESAPRTSYCPITVTITPCATFVPSINATILSLPAVGLTYVAV